MVLSISRTLMVPSSATAPEAAPLPVIRAMLLWALVLGSVGMLTELLLIGHRESTAQFVPLALLGVSVGVGAMNLRAPVTSSVRLLQVLMVLLIGSGVLGVGLHYHGNEEFEIEMYPSLSGLALVKETLTGATPVLAPGSMSLLGVIGLAFTYRHPALRARADLAQSQEKQS